MQTSLFLSVKHVFVMDQAAVLQGQQIAGSDVHLYQDSSCSTLGTVEFLTYESTSISLYCS